MRSHRETRWTTALASFGVDVLLASRQNEYHEGWASVATRMPCIQRLLRACWSPPGRTGRGSSRFSRMRRTLLVVLNDVSGYRDIRKSIAPAPEPVPAH